MQVARGACLGGCKQPRQAQGVVITLAARALHAEQLLLADVKSLVHYMPGIIDGTANAWWLPAQAASHGSHDLKGGLQPLPEASQS
jgi:hypothetical protein